MATISTELLRNIHEVTNNRPLTKEELQVAYLAGFIHTCFDEDFKDPSTWKADSELVGYVAVRLTEATAQIFQEISDKQTEVIRQLIKDKPLNG
jgi:hypothetical protein